MERMHKLGVIHRSLKAVCPFLRLHFVQAFAFLQTAVLVDAHEHACVAGLSVAFPPCDVPRKDTNCYFRGLAPGLIDLLYPGVRWPSAPSNKGERHVCVWRPGLGGESEARVPYMRTTQWSGYLSQAFAWQAPFPGMGITGVTPMVEKDHRLSPSFRR